MNRISVLSIAKKAASGVALASLVACGGGLPSFGADFAKQASPVGGDDIRVPYTSLISYFGYVEPGATPDEVRDGKKMFYLYVWVPIVAPEIGVRMVSPVANLAKPAEGDFVDPAFAEKGAADTTNYFDTWVRVERCLTAINPEDIEKPCDQWTIYGDNDDSSELPPNPAGQNYNSVLRVTSTVDDPMKALVRGLYRIAFTTYKAGEVQGSFLAQVGAPIELPGTAIARSPAELAKKITADEAPVADAADAPEATEAAEAPATDEAAADAPEEGEAAAE